MIDENKKTFEETLNTFPHGRHGLSLVHRPNCFSETGADRVWDAAMTVSVQDERRLMQGLLCRQLSYVQSKRRADETGIGEPDVQCNAALHVLILQTDLRWR